MIYLMPNSVRVTEEGITKQSELIEHPITAMAQAMSRQEDSFWRVPEEKLSDWLPVFELTTPAPVILTGFRDIIPPVWNALPTNLPRRDVYVVADELKALREAATRKDQPLPETSDALDRRAGSGHRREPEIDVVDVEQTEE